MSDRNFMEMIRAKWAEGKFLCVGLDSDVKKIPQSIPVVTSELRQIYFNSKIIDATHHIVCAFKPNRAFYARHGEAGCRALRETIQYIHVVVPDVPIILDGKWGDIDNTNLGYIDEAFDYYGADAITLHPYMGQESLKPYLERKDKGLLVLCRTSNKGAGEFQDIDIDNPEYLADPQEDSLADSCYFAKRSVRLYEYVARRVSKHWNTNGNCGLVVGATYPEELAEVRRIVGDMPILLPGIGAQGAEVEATVKNGKNSKNQGIIINAARSVIFASAGEDYQEAAQREAQELHTQIQKFLTL